MKPTILLLLSVIAGYSQSSVAWQTRMIQNQLDGATGMPELVADEGERPSLPIGANGSRFELWGFKLIEGSIAVEKLLDTTEVGVYLPAAEISIATADPYTGFNRSRVDQAFTVSYQISNLRAAGPDIPTAATKVRVEHYVDLYHLDSFDGTSIESTILFQSFELTANGTHSYPFAVTNLSAPDLVRRAGRERFIVYALEDGATPERQIAEQTLSIFPMSLGTLNIDDTKTHKSLPPFSAQLWRVYPASSTWVEVYDGEYVEGKRGTMLATTYETAGRIYPDAYNVQHFTTFPDSIQPTVKARKTIVLLASSPFNEESIEKGGRPLDHATIDVSNEIKVNGMLTTIE